VSVATTRREATAATSQLLLTPEVEELQRRWLVFAAHARLCAHRGTLTGDYYRQHGRLGCHDVAKACCQPGRQSQQLDPLYEDCCEEGKPLYADWRLACSALRAAYTRS